MPRIQKDLSSITSTQKTSQANRLLNLLQLTNQQNINILQAAFPYVRLTSKDLLGYDQLIAYYHQVFKRKTALQMRTKWHNKDKIVLIWTVVAYSLAHNVSKLELSPSDWKQLGLLLNMKEEFLMRKWITMIRHTTHSHQWTQKEEITLLGCMQNQNQQYHWSDIALKIYTQEHGSVLRTCKDIREHWNNHLDPSLKKCSWTKNQEELLLELVKVNGKKWSFISKFIEGRTENQVKNRYFSVMKKNMLEPDQHGQTQQSHNESDRIDQLQMKNIQQAPFLFEQNEVCSNNNYFFQFLQTDNVDLFWNI